MKRKPKADKDRMKARAFTASDKQFAAISQAADRIFHGNVSLYIRDRLLKAVEKDLS